MKTIYTIYVEDMKNVDMDNYQVITFCQNVLDDDKCVNFGSLVPGSEMVSSYNKLKCNDRDELFLKHYFKYVLKPMFKNNIAFARMLQLSKGKELCLARQRYTQIPDFFNLIKKYMKALYDVEFVDVKICKSEALF